MIQEIFNKHFRKNSADPVGRSQRAQGLFEFALILPLLLLFIYGIIEVGRMMAIFSSVSSAARQAARYGSVGGDSGNGMAYFLDCAGMRQTAKNTSLLQPLADTDISIHYDQGLVTQTLGLCATGDITPTLSRIIQDGDRVVISITTTYKPIVPIVPLPAIPMGFVAAHTIFTTIVGPTPTPQPNPSLLISKVGSPTSLIPGGPAGMGLTYTIQITNTGPVAATGIIVTDTLPPTMDSRTVVWPPTAPGWTCGQAGSIITCTMPFLGSFAGGNVSTPITLNVTAPIMPGIITNTAQVGYSLPDPNPANNTATASTFIATWVDLELRDISLVNPVPAGQPASYALMVKNNNWVDASSVTVTDTLPAGTTYFSSGGLNWLCTPGLGTVTCTDNVTLTVGSTAPTLTVVVLAPIPAPASHLITNTATATSNLNDPFPNNNTNITATTTVLDAAGLAMFKFGPATVDASSLFNYTLHVTDNGPGPATNITVTDPIPPLASIQSVTGGSGWSCPPPSGITVTCTYSPTLTVGATTSDITITVQAPATNATLVNAATAVSSAPLPPPPLYNTATVTTTVSTCHHGLVDPNPAHSGVTTSTPSVGIDSTSTGLVLVTLRDDCDFFVAAPPYHTQQVTLTSSRGGLDTITLNGSYSNPTSNGQVGFNVSSNTAGTSTYSAVAKDTVTNATVSLVSTAQVTFVPDCVTFRNAPLGGSQAFLQFIASNTNAFGYTRHLTNLSLSWPQSGGRRISSLALQGTTLWSGAPGTTNNPFVIPSGLSWIAGTDPARTLSSGVINKILQFNFTFNVNATGTYNLSTTWDDGGGGHVCTANIPVTP